jgi:bifunctional DNA-binding transcriptional regulator/antitoxin component of YhaV-PrlF toxin-antitoxin module
MVFSLTMLDHGRVTLPIAMRRKYDLNPGSQFDFTVPPNCDYGILTHLPKAGESYKGSWTFRIVQG